MLCWAAKLTFQSRFLPSPSPRSPSRLARNWASGWARSAASIGDNPATVGIIACSAIHTRIWSTLIVRYPAVSTPACASTSPMFAPGSPPARTAFRSHNASVPKLVVDRVHERALLPVAFRRLDHRSTSSTPDLPRGYTGRRAAKAQRRVGTALNRLLPWQCPGASSSIGLHRPARAVGANRRVPPACAARPATSSLANRT